MSAIRINFILSMFLALTSCSVQLYNDSSTTGSIGAGGSSYNYSSYNYGYSSTSNGGGTGSTTTYTLPANGSWYTGTLSTLVTDTSQYAITTTAGQVILLNWDDSYSGSGVYTADVYVKAFSASGVLLGGDWYSGYNSYQSITATDSRIYVRVYRISHGGTFAIKATSTTVTPSNTISYTPLTLSSSFTTGNLTYPDTMYYRITVTPGVMYTVTWDDNYQGSGLYTGDMKVDATSSTGLDYWVGGYDSGYLTPHTVTPTSTPLILKVWPYSASGDNGTYAIKIQ